MIISRIASSQNRDWRNRALPGAIILALAMSAPTFAGSDASGTAAASSQQMLSTQHVSSHQNDKQGKDQNNTESDRSQQANEKNAKALGAVVVTATGRAQQAVTVPYNIQVISGQNIANEHIRNRAELLRSVAGINVINGGARDASVVNNVRMRGINTDTAMMGDYPTQAVAPVATYVNNVPIFANFLPMDINRVELLKGPQGTLYGSGSLGGTIRYILNKPQLDQFSGWVSASGSSVSGSSSIGNSESAMLNFPIGETLALRIDAKHNDFPGATDDVNLYELNADGNPVAPAGILSPEARTYVRKDADTVRQDYGRLSMLWKPTDRFSLQLNYMAQADDIGARRGMSPGTNGYGVPYQRHEMGAVLLEPSSRHVHLTSLEATIDLGFGTLTSSTSNYEQHGRIFTDNTGFFAGAGTFSLLFYNYPRPAVASPREYSSSAFTEEIRLTSSLDGPFDYIVGLYYHDGRAFQVQDENILGFKSWWDVAFPAFQSSVISDHFFDYTNNSKTREVALYGQGIWHINPSLQLTFGARSFRERFTADISEFIGLYAGARSAVSSSDTEDTRKTIFYGNLSWWFNPYNQLYATVSQGYRRGGANGVPLSGFFAEDSGWQFYKPDTVTNHEIGVKGMAGGLTYTADIYYTDWEDPQFDTNTTNWGFLAVQNFGHATVKGAEVQLQGAAGDHFRYGFGYAYTHARLTEDAYTADGLFLIANAGARLPGVSRNQLTGTASYSWHAEQGLFTLHLDGAYQSPTQNSIGPNKVFNFPLGGFTVWNAYLSFSLPKWTASLWVKNLGNVKGVTGEFSPAYMGPSPAQNFFGSNARLITTMPRTVGATVTFRF